MRYLYIDTSSNFLYSAIAEDNKILNEIKKEFGQSLSSEALPEISNLFIKSKLEPRDIEKIIVVIGPGSFTGIRIGVTIAKVYAWALNIPITTISALEVMSISCEKDCYHVPIIDARRNYAYAAIYKNGKEVFKPSHLKVTDIINEISKLDNYVIITNDEVKGLNNFVKYSPNILKVINLCKDRNNINPHSVNPEYLKLTEAEESKLNDN